MPAVFVLPKRSLPAAGPAAPVLIEAKDRCLLLLFDRQGLVHWMNAPARKVWKGCCSLLQVVTSAPGRGEQATFPFGKRWLWIRTPGEDRSRRTGQLERASRHLSDCCEKRAKRNAELAGAESKLNRYYYAPRESSPGGADQLIEAVEAERGRIARELHDSAQQWVSGIAIHLELVERSLGAAETEALARLGKSKELVQGAMEEIRRISHELHPPEWEGMSFGDAVSRLIDEMGLRSKLHVEMGPIYMPSDLTMAAKTVLYRAVQGGLTNVLRHARATKIVIEAAVSPRGVELRLSDDGVGFNARTALASGRGLGLTSMRQRVQAIGGQVRIDSEEGKGTRLLIFLPHPSS